jgi:hypothetical protein
MPVMIRTQIEASNCLGRGRLPLDEMNGPRCREVAEEQIRPFYPTSRTEHV